MLLNPRPCKTGGGMGNCQRGAGVHCMIGKKSQAAVCQNGARPIVCLMWPHCCLQVPGAVCCGRLYLPVQLPGIQQLLHQAHDCQCQVQHRMRKSFLGLPPPSLRYFATERLPSGVKEPGFAIRTLPPCHEAEPCCWYAQIQLQR